MDRRVPLFDLNKEFSYISRVSVLHPQSGMPTTGLLPALKVPGRDRWDRAAEPHDFRNPDAAKRTCNLCGKTYHETKLHTGGARTTWSPFAAERYSAKLRQVLEQRQSM